LWGDSDAVSPMEIPKYLAQNVIPFRFVKGVTMKDTGHFLMMERPVDWARIILDFIAKSKEPYVEKRI
jgi:pimeloyl-ACP methyl ester carboxylesterase